MNNKKVYIINGCMNESGDTFAWVEEVFENEEQAKACCKFLELTNNDGRKNFHISEHEINTHNYMDELVDEKRWVQELIEYQEKMHRGEWI